MQDLGKDTVYPFPIMRRQTSNFTRQLLCCENTFCVNTTAPIQTQNNVLKEIDILCSFLGSWALFVSLWILLAG